MLAFQYDDRAEKSPRPTRSSCPPVQSSTHVEKSGSPMSPAMRCSITVTSGHVIASVTTRYTSATIDGRDHPRRGKACMGRVLSYFAMRRALALVACVSLCAGCERVPQPPDAEATELASLPIRVDKPLGTDLRLAGMRI